MSVALKDREYQLQHGYGGVVDFLWFCIYLEYRYLYADLVEYGSCLVSRFLAYRVL